MSNPSNSILGRRVRVMIAEPWDFVSDAGANILAGEVVEVSGVADQTEWLRCEIHPFQCAGISVREVALVRRYADSCTITEQLVRGENVGVNILFDSQNGILNLDNLRTALVTKTGLSFLAGSARML